MRPASLFPSTLYAPCCRLSDFQFYPPQAPFLRALPFLQALFNFISPHFLYLLFGLRRDFYTRSGGYEVGDHPFVAPGETHIRRLSCRQ